MGWFGNLLGNVIDFIDEKVNETIDRTLEKVINVLDKADEMVQNFKHFVFGDPGHADENSSVAELVDVQKNLNEMRATNEKFFKKQALAFETILTDFFDDMVSGLKDGGILERYNINLFEYEADIRKIIGNISENYKNVSTQRIALSDSECAEILKIYDKEERVAAEREFSEKIKREASQKLLIDFQKSYNTLFNRLKNNIQSALDDCNRRYNDTCAAFEKLINSDKPEAEKIGIQAQIAYDTCVIAKNCLKPSA